MITLTTKINENDGVLKKFLKMTATFWLTFFWYAIQSILTACVIFFLVLPIISGIFQNECLLEYFCFSEIFWLCCSVNILVDMSSEGSWTIRI